MPCTSAGRRSLQDARGSVTVEFAIIAPVVVLLVGALLVVGVFQTRLGALNLAASVAVEQIAHGMPQGVALGQLDQLHPGNAVIESGPSQVCLRVAYSPTVPRGLGWLLDAMPAPPPVLQCASRVP